jgi:hypothetical protein
MKHTLILLPIVFIFSIHTFSQTPDDALRNAWFIPGGSARNMAIGGAMGSLGGDISANHINPAGLGFFKTKEIVISPGILMNNNTADYRGTNSSALKNTAFAFGVSGYVDGGHTSDTKNFETFAITLNQTASFNNRVYYKGDNNATSYSEQYLEELARDGANVDAASNNYIFGSTLAFFTYLIDSVNDGNGNLIGYRSLVTPSAGLSQQYDAVSSGGLYELALGYASNKEDKLYLGASLGIPLSVYKQETNFTETDISGDNNNDFGFSKFHQTINSTGVGINLKLGLIYKPEEYIRLGLALHSPSFFVYDDKIRADMTTNSEGYAGIVSVSSDALNNGNAGTNNYTQSSPWRAIASASFVFRESNDAKLQKGFLTADIEYVNYQATRYHATQDANGYTDPVQQQYFTALKSATKDYLKGAFNFRVGAEVKFSPWMVRAGLGYYGNPYQDNLLKSSRLLGAGGIGYRDKGMFIDLTYAYTVNKDVNFPYRLNDAPNTFASTKNNRGNMLLTVGFKL